MIAKFIILIIFILHIPASLSAIAPKEARCKTASKMVEAGWDEELAIVGDCYLYGVHFKQDREQARFHYLQAMIAGSSYAQYKVAEDYLYFPKTESEVALGYYLLDDLVQGKKNKSRAYSAYLLGIFERDSGDVERSIDYLRIAQQDSFFDASYALAYLEYEENGESDTYKELIFESEKYQKEIQLPRLISFSCWLDFQKTRDHPFVMDSKVVAKLKASIGGCVKQK